VERADDLLLRTCNEAGSALLTDGWFELGGRAIQIANSLDSENDDALSSVAYKRFWVQGSTADLDALARDYESVSSPTTHAYNARLLSYAIDFGARDKRPIAASAQHWLASFAQIARGASTSGDAWANSEVDIFRLSFAWLAHDHRLEEDAREKLRVIRRRRRKVRAWLLTHPSHSARHQDEMKRIHRRLIADQLLTGRLLNEQQGHTLVGMLARARGLLAA
jgi:hypothetical protein